MYRMVREQPSGSGLQVTLFDAVKRFGEMTLTKESLRILIIPNAGGSSVVSEVLSYEYMRKCYEASLLKTEMEVEYFPMGGSITDYVMQLFDRKVAVSVTRGVKFGGEEFTVDDGLRLLSKKLNGIQQADRNSLESWQRHVLHVWADGPVVTRALVEAYNRLPQDLLGSVIVLVTCVRNCREIFTDKDEAKI